MITNALVMARLTSLKSLGMAVLFRAELTVKDDVIELGFLISVRILEIRIADSRGHSNLERKLHTISQDQNRHQGALTCRDVW